MIKRQHTVTTFILLLSVLLALFSGGCAQNPVTGKSDFVLMSEDQEIAIGRQNHPQILKQYGEVNDAKLQRYVQNVGARVARISHRSNLIFRFTLLDSAEVNAFALPGGYIYITRGLLAYLNNEAQLAAVLGHEIGHVSARHSVRQQSAGAATGLLGAIIAASIDIPQASNLVNVAGTALVRGYGREHELEADRLGAEYLARSGYSPAAMLDVIRVLKDQETFEKTLAKQQDREPRVYHGVFATHPDNDSRLKNVVGRANALKVRNPRINRTGFLNNLNGMTFGAGEREGILRGRDFYHKPLGIALRFPKDWKVQNLPDRLLTHPLNRAAVMQITIEDINRRISPRDFMIQRMRLKNISHDERIRNADGMQGYTAIATVRTSYGNRKTRFVVMYFENRAYIFAGAGKNIRDPFQYDREFISVAKSLRRLRSSETRLATPLKIRIVKANKRTRFSRLARKSRITNNPEQQLRLLNQRYPRGEPANGEYIKVVK
ncbi:MAG: M48 family metalloprotease [Gammaproteobacteria bacterium]|nr:MAG: M48 family metalloprotease [Gammaproteobacteria bacterium]